MTAVGFTMASKTSLLVNEVVEIFECSYGKHSEFLVSCMFANLGIYSIADNVSKEPEYEQSLCEIWTSHVWKELRVVSPMLRRSVLYTLITIATPYIFVMDDKKLSKGLLNFKKDIVAFMKRNATLLAYCDIEGTEFFTVVNGLYAYNPDLYHEHCQKAAAEIKRIYLNHKHKVPKATMFVLDDIQDLLFIRQNTKGDLSRPTDFSTFPQFPKFHKEKFQEDILKYSHGTTRTLVKPLTRIYRQIIPFHVLSYMQPLLTLHGEKSRDTESVGDKMNTDVMHAIKVLKNFLNTHSVSPLKKEIQNMSVMVNSFDIVDFDILFDSYSFEPIGCFALHAFNTLNEFLQQNLGLIVLADLLYIGVYDAVSKEHQVDVETLSNMIMSCEKDLTLLYDELYPHSSLFTVFQPLFEQIDISLKRVKRYESYTRFINDTEEIPTYINMIFGDLQDKDGSPATCAICLEDASESKDTWFPLACKHHFHVNCINTLMLTCECAKCPLCRLEV